MSRPPQRSGGSPAFVTRMLHLLYSCLAFKSVSAASVCACRLTLPAYGSTTDSLMRIRREDVVLWVVFR